MMATKVSNYAHTPVRVTHLRRGERDPHSSLPHLQHSLGRAALAGGDHSQDHDAGAEQPPGPVSLEELQRRAGIMFSGATGVVVASGDQGVTSVPSYQLVKDVFAVLEALPPTLFDKDAKDRPCGLLDKYGAAGMLIGDVLGLPVIPWVLAEPIGKAAAKLPAEIPAEKKKAKKAAKRKGTDPDAAEAEVLGRRVKLKLPTKADISATVKALAKAAEQASAPPPPPPPPHPPVEAPAPAPAPAPVAPRRLFPSKEAAEVAHADALAKPRCGVGSSDGVAVAGPELGDRDVEDVEEDESLGPRQVSVWSKTWCVPSEACLAAVVEVDALAEP